MMIDVRVYMERGWDSSLETIEKEQLHGCMRV